MTKLGLIVTTELVPEETAPSLLLSVNAVHIH